MLNISRVLNMRRRRSRRLRQQSWLPAGFSISLIAGLLFLALIFSLAGIYLYLWPGLPSLEQLPILLNGANGQLLRPTALYDRSATQVIAVLEDPRAHDRQYLPLQGQAKHIPQSLVDAILAALDPAFWQHNGCQLSNHGTDSHSTLAQRLVYETLLADERAGLRRSLRECLLAVQVTKRFGREQILEWYLNHARFGNIVYGVDAAARVYLGKPANDVSLAEAAALAAIARLPEVSPYQAPQLLLAEQNQIIQRLLDGGQVTAEQARQASQVKITFQPPLPAENLATPFVDLVLAQLEDQVPRQRLERGGWQIITTLDLDLQTQVECATSTLVDRLTLVNEAVEGAPSSSQPSACPAAQLLPTMPLQSGERLSGLESAVIVLEPHSGQVLGLAVSMQRLETADAVGTLPGRPAGTALLTFLYLNAFSRGQSPATLVWDVPPASSASDIDWQAYHGPVRLRTALANDYLEPARQLLTQFGLETTLTTARQLGVLPEGTRLAAGSAETDSLALYLSQPVSLLGLAQAYATIGNQGLAAGQVISPEAQESLQPYTVLRLENYQGQVWLDWSSPQQRSVLSPQLAYLVNHSLSDETVRWPTLGHPNPLEIGRPASAKLGQTRQQQDSWAIGYTPQRLVGVWLGLPAGGVVESAAASDSVTEPEQRLPERAAAALWHAVIQYAARDLPATGWTLPLGISELQVCDPSGLLPTVYCPQVVNEVFLTGSEPHQADQLYRLYQVNRETGRLATVFTPPELIEDQVYLIFPPEARAWASQAGLPVPPEDYDALYTPPEAISGGENVALTSPAMFSHVHGLVTLRGSAAGPGFKSYRLNFGQGLNPSQWLQIGQDSTGAVKDGTLGAWDTQGLNGLYALQLQVVRQDQRIETAVIQVTVDNIAPEVTLVSPEDQAVFTLASQPDLVLNARASDNLEVAQVAYAIDGKSVASLVQPPYVVSWRARLGEHELVVTVTDLAGNQASAEIAFTVK